jgi:hypothetical protein
VLILEAIGSLAKLSVDPDPFKGSATEVARRLGVRGRAVQYRRARRRLGFSPGKRTKRARFRRKIL